MESVLTTGFVKNHFEITSDFANLGISFKGLSQLPKDVTEEILEATKFIFKEIPILKNFVTKFEVEELEESSIAETYPLFKDGKLTFAISFNSLLWTDSQKIRKDLKDNYKSHFLATDTIAGVVYHEIGHVVNGIIICNNKNKPFNNWLFKMFLWDWKRNLTTCKIMQKYNITDDLIQEISNYATRDSGEAYAEIFASYYCGDILPSGMIQMMKNTVVFKK